MTNKLSIAEQLTALLAVLKTRPLLSAALAILVAFCLYFGNNEATVWRFTTTLTGPDREIETLIIANPNVVKRDVFVEFSPTGPSGLTPDLGYHQSTAIEYDSKTAQSARLNVGERGVSIITILRKDLQHSPTKAVAPAKEATPTDSIMRQLAFAYLIGLALYLQSYITSLSVAWGVLTAYSTFGRTNLQDLRDQAMMHAKGIIGRTPPKQEQILLKQEGTPPLTKQEVTPVLPKQEETPAKRDEGS